MNSIKCVLFDLDGTLLDTSYDFAYALKKTCETFNRPVISYDLIRQTVSQGGLAVTKLAFSELEERALEDKRQFFLDTYFENIARHTDVFPGLHAGLEALAEHQIPWGIVTNKPTWLTEKLLESFQFPSNPSSIVCGDTLDVRKPDAKPLLLAAQQCGHSAAECLYLGDHPRDIEAGKNAKMRTGAALFGYLPSNCDPLSWQADINFHTPAEISDFLKTEICTT